MSKFESFPLNSEIVADPKTEESIEVNETSKVHKIIDWVRQNAPSFEHVKSGARWLAVGIAAFGSMEARAQEIPPESDLFSDTINVNHVNDMSMYDIKSKLAEFSQALPEDIEAMAKFKVEEGSGVQLTKKQDGQINLESSELGDLEVVTSTRHIKREVDNEYSNSFTREIQVSKPFSTEKINGTGEKLKAEALGTTKEEAVINALGQLSEQINIQLRNVTALEKIENVNLEDKYTNITATDSNNYLDSVKIINVQEIESDNGQTSYLVQIEAEIGSLAGQ